MVPYIFSPKRVSIPPDNCSNSAKLDVDFATNVPIPAVAAPTPTKAALPIPAAIPLREDKPLLARSIAFSESEDA